jgi:hypothetical protein
LLSLFSFAELVTDSLSLSLIAQEEHGEGLEIASMDGSEDGYVSPSFDDLLGSDPSDDDGEAFYDPKKEAAKEAAKSTASSSNKKRRVRRREDSEDEDMGPKVDLEALALKALARR